MTLMIFTEYEFSLICGKKQMKNMKVKCIVFSFPILIIIIIIIIIIITITTTTTTMGKVHFLMKIHGDCTAKAIPKRLLRRCHEVTMAF